MDLVERLRQKSDSGQVAESGKTDQSLAERFVDLELQMEKLKAEMVRLQEGPALIRLSQEIKTLHAHQHRQREELERLRQETDSNLLKAIQERMQRLENILLLDEGWDQIKERLLRLEHLSEQQREVLQQQFASDDMRHQSIASQQEELAAQIKKVEEQSRTLGDSLHIPQLRNELQGLKSELNERLKAAEEQSQSLMQNLREDLASQSKELVEQILPRLESLESLRSLVDRTEHLEQFQKEVTSKMELLVLVNQNAESIRDQVEILRNLREEQKEIQKAIATLDALRPLAEQPERVAPLFNFQDKVREVVGSDTLWQRIQALEGLKALWQRVESLEKVFSRIDALDILRPLAEQPERLAPLYDFSERVKEIVGYDVLWNRMQELESLKALVPRLETLENLPSRIEALESLRQIPEEIQLLKARLKEGAGEDQLQTSLQSLTDRVATVEGWLLELDSLREVYDRLNEMEKQNAERLTSAQQQTDSVASGLKEMRTQVREAFSMLQAMKDEMRNYQEIKAAARLGRVERSLRQLERVLDIQTIISFFERSQKLLPEQAAPKQLEKDNDPSW